MTTEIATETETEIEIGARETGIGSGVRRTAIGGAANAAITALNAIEQPIAEEEWKKRKEEADKEPARKTGERTMISEGGLVVVAPVLFLGVAFALWGLGGDLGWF